VTGGKKLPLEVEEQISDKTDARTSWRQPRMQLEARE